MYLSEKQKTLLFYALEAMERTLTTDEEGDLYFNYLDYMPCQSELQKLGDEQTLRQLIDKTLSTLC